jgi:electron transport complex protein RnfD
MLISLSSPHIKGNEHTANVMRWVIVATLPGLAALTWSFGWGSLLQVVLCSGFALAGEALVLRLRKRSLAFFLGDYSALLTGVLLGLALPPYAPWWIACIGGLFSIIAAKHLYGGLGQNPFNPAMVGYALLLVSFPLAMTTNWGIHRDLTEAGLPGLLETLNLIFQTTQLPADAYTMATPLDIYKHEISAGTFAEVTTLPAFGEWIARGWELSNLGFLAGGLLLLWKKIITWHIPLSFLAALSLCSLMLGWDEDSFVPLQLHLLAGATMLGAFFIATDPVSAATSLTGKLWYGAGIGVLVYIIRTWGSYPDAVAFAVLLMNFVAPFLDYFTQPRAYGHAKATRSVKKEN